MEEPRLLRADGREEKASPFLADSAKRRNLAGWRELLVVQDDGRDLLRRCSLLFLQGVCA
jgi:hypothetical protein